MYYTKNAVVYTFNTNSTYINRNIIYKHLYGMSLGVFKINIIKIAVNRVQF